MRVLLTRPSPEASRTKASLEDLGHQVWVAPVTQIVPCEADWPSGAVDAVMATSAQAFGPSIKQAVRQGNTCLSIEARRLVPLLLVGERTRGAARRCGWEGPATVAPTAADLVASIAREILRPHRIVYMAGRDRKPDLEMSLHKEGHQVTVVETYEALPAAHLEAMAAQALRAGAIDAVLHYSRRSATLFLMLAAGAGADVTAPLHVCLSADAAAPLREAGCTEIVVATAPNEAALFNCLEASLESVPDQA